MHVNFMKDDSGRDILQIDGARIKNRNFSGERGGEYDREGKRNFLWAIDDPELAEELLARGWPVKIYPPKDEDGDANMFMKVSLSYNDAGYGPRVYLRSGNARVRLNADTIKRLDEISIDSVDMDIRAYDWTYAGRSGRSAYLNAIRVTQRMDRFEDEFEDNDYYEENPF